MLVGMLNEILDGQSSCLFSNEPFEKRHVMTISFFLSFFIFEDPT